MAEASRNVYPSSGGVVRDQENAQEMLKTLKKHYDKAYADIQIALRLDEQSKRDEAIRFYCMGLKSISLAMKIDCKGPQCVGSQWDHARSMQQKMKKTAQQMETRLKSFEEEQQAQVLSADQVSAENNNLGYEDEVSSEILSVYHESETPPTLPSYAQSTADAREVLSISHGVQLFFINSSGHVSAPSSPGPLKVYKFPEDQRLTSNRPPAFLQVGEWLYPLLPGQSPSLKAADGVYMFPDVSSLDQGASVGVIFSPQVTRQQKANFRQLIQQLTAMKEEQVPMVQEATTNYVPQENGRLPSEGARRREVRSDDGERDDAAHREAVETEEVGAKTPAVSQTIAKGLEKGAEWISWGVVKGAEIGCKLVGSGAKKLKQHIQPDEQPKEIDEKYQTGMVYARKATGVAVKVSKVVLDSVYFLTKRLAEEIGPVISQQAQKMLISGDDETDGKRKAIVDGVVEVTASGIRGFGKVYNGLEVAAIQLAKSMSQATVETVNHKYGDDAGRLTDNSLATVGNIGVSAYTLNNLGVKALAKRTAKDTGKVVVKDLENSRNQVKDDTSRKT